MSGNGLSYKTTLINNRRYLGNKYKLLRFIDNEIRSNCSNIVSFADIFSGTGAVSSAFTDKKLITNDLMYSNYLCNYAWFGTQEYDSDKVIDYIVRYNSMNEYEENYMTLNFSDTYFSREVCSKIGLIREDIERNYGKGSLNFRERSLLITSLLYAMDRIAMTCGHYDAYRKNAKCDGILELYVPQAVVNNNQDNKCFNEDANSLVKRIEADVVYIDPPYNSRQYCDAYHLLENVARWEKPEVFGVARKMDRRGLKSKYCTSSATEAFAQLVGDIHARYIVLSYNNMGLKGNSRSNAKISDSAILEILKEKGSVEVFCESYKPFSAGKSSVQDNAERLFICVCS